MVKMVAWQNIKGSILSKVTKTVYHMQLESVNTRYTCEWAEVIPRELMKRNVRVVNLLGDTSDASTTTEGAFLNFAATNVWKNEQTSKLAKLFANGEIKNGDHIFWPDAWHPGIIQARYMADLFDIDVRMSGYWHAGSYDPNDFLGRKVKDKKWSYNVERGYFFALDYNFFATDYHIKLMTSTLGINSSTKSIIKCGQPHNKLIESLYVGQKRNLILFPHRISPEKQPDIFTDLATLLPEYEFVFCQRVCKSKADYHKLLSEAKIVFSANLQETLGISAMEGVLAQAIPLVPDRLSYSEMYPIYNIYPSIWTENWQSYCFFRDFMVGQIKTIMDNYQFYADALPSLKESLISDYLTADIMFDIICKNNC